MTTTRTNTTRTAARTATRRTAIVAGAAALVATAALGAAPLAQAAPSAPSAAPALTTAAKAHPTNGWSAVILARSTTSGGTLTLVSPTGAQYRVAGVSATSDVRDVSNDGRTVLLATLASGNHPGYRVVDTRTGRSTAVAGDWGDLRFTNPGAQNLIGRSATTSGLVRLGLDGRVKVSFAGTAGGWGMLPSPDGTLLVAGNAAHQLQVNGNATGARLRVLPTPKGYEYCSAGHWSSATQFTGTCQSTARSSVARVFRFSTTGAAPVPLTATLVTAGSLQWGYSDSWATPRGQVVQAVSPCGPSRLALVKGRSVSLFRVGEDAGPLGVVGSSAYYLTGGGCGSANAGLSRYDVATGRMTVLAGGRANKGLVVTSVALVDAKQ